MSVGEGSRVGRTWKSTNVSGIYYFLCSAISHRGILYLFPRSVIYERGDREGSGR